MKRLILSAFICMLALASVVLAQTARRALTVDDLLRVRRVGAGTQEPAA